MIRKAFIFLVSGIMCISCATVDAGQSKQAQTIEGFTPARNSAASDDQTSQIQDTGDAVPAESPGRRHSQAVLAIRNAAPEGTFFSAGADGFVTKHDADGSSETWQVSDVMIQKIAINTLEDVLSVYETDGFSLHRISVWNWRTKRRLYAKRFKDSVRSLEWSAKGTWLMIGTASVDGMTLLESKSGKFKQVFSQPPGVVNLGATGASETSMVTFGPSGRLLYTDISSGKIRAEYQSQTDLNSPMLLNNKRFIAGYRDGFIEMFDATSGKAVSSWPAQNPVAAGSKNDIVPWWVERGADNDWLLKDGNNGISVFTLPEGVSVTAAERTAAGLLLGLSTGELMTAEHGSGAPAVGFQQPAAAIARITEISLQRIDDLATDGSRVFFLSKGAVFISSGPGAPPVFAFDGISGNRIKLFEDSLVFWSTTEAVPVIQTSLDGDKRKELHSAQEGISSLFINSDGIVFLEGNRLAVVKKNNGSELQYPGIGFQDVVPIDENFILISKSSNSRTPNPLILVNIITGETVPLPITGDLLYGLSRSIDDNDAFFGFLVKGGQNKATELVSIRVDPVQILKTTATVIASYADEDLNASLMPINKGIITNLGKSSLVEIPASGGVQFRYDRGYSLPEKCSMTDQYVVSLNRDGSLSWYDKNRQEVVSTAAISSEGYWIE